MMLKILFFLTITFMDNLVQYSCFVLNVGRNRNNFYFSKYYIGFEISKTLLHANCDLSADSLYGRNGEDLVWEALRRDAAQEASREPLLASFMHASILSHYSLEQSLAFHMSNLLNSPAMISTQIQSIYLEALEKAPNFRDSLRLDILAVMLRDPAVTSYTDVLLYFKGFQALQTHRVAHWLWTTERATLG